MSVNATTAGTGSTQGTSSTQGRLAVPWATVLPMAVAMAFADGFWMTSLRGATGAIERTQEPFASWLRESTLVLPVFVVAVLAALTLSLRWFGPVLGTLKTVVATALMVVAAGTLVGVVELAASSAFDYHLQSSQQRLMDSMRGTGVGSVQTQQAAFGLQVHAVGYGIGILVVTNLALVGWVVAVRGGRLNVSTNRGRAARRVDDLRMLLAAGLVGSTVIHAAVVPEHLREWGAAGAFFVALVAAELAMAALLFVRPRPHVLRATAALSLGPLALWLYSRTLGMPFGPGTGVPEPVGLADCAASLLELGSLFLAVILLRAPRWQRRAPVSAHVRWLTVVAVIAVTAIGLAGSGLAWVDDFGSSGDRPGMVAAHAVPAHAPAAITLASVISRR